MKHVILILMLLSIPVLAQTPADTRVSLAESRASAEKARAEVCEARREALEREIANQPELIATKKSVVVLQASNDRARQRIAELETQAAANEAIIAERNATIDRITKQRDLAAAEAKHARSWKASFVRIFGMKPDKR